MHISQTLVSIETIRLFVLIGLTRLARLLVRFAELSSSVRSQIDIIN